VTKKFYRRQMTWFKLKDERISWFDLEEHPEEKIFDQIHSFLEEI
jgi:tRNA A37 N6-isopentenylltransferase MiaA